jgi:hypothetical protein
MSLLIVSLFLPSTLAVSLPFAIPSGLKRRTTGSKTSPDIVSLDLVPNSHGNIGLQNAIASISSDKMSRRWIGTLGISTGKMSSAQRQQLTENLKKIEQVPVFVTDEEVDGHYNQFCKRVYYSYNSSCSGKRFIISF